jgi:hypothetical protein
MLKNSRSEVCSRMGEVDLPPLTMSFKASTVRIEVFAYRSASEVFSCGGASEASSCGSASDVVPALPVG